MTNGKFTSGWKNTLEDVAGLPGETMQNKEVAWEKLHARLHRKPKSKRIIVYWLAAASVIAAVTLSFIGMNKSVTEVAIHENTQHDIKNTPAKKDNTIKNITPQVTVAQAGKPLQKNNIVKHSKTKTIPVDSANTVPANSIVQELHNQAAASPVAVDTLATATILPMPAQKKLKVVHINELGEPVEYPADVTHNADLHIFQLKLAQQEIYNASSIVSNDNSVLSIKPKRSN